MATLRQYQQRHATLKNQRASWLSHWGDIAELVLPRKERVFMTEPNDGTRRNEQIINGTATRALRILTSGMHTSQTSPNRPWFTLTTRDPELGSRGPMKQWLFRVEQIMRETFLRSNIYTALPELYAQLATFGTAVAFLEPDAQDVIRAYVLPVGQYNLASSSRRAIDTLYRETHLSTEELVFEFGYDRVSDSVQRLYDRGHYDVWHEIVHLVEPNRERRPDAMGPESKTFRSVWYEQGARDEQFLRASGFDQFPVLAARWDTTAEEVYGSSCPGMEALGDILELQKHAKEKATTLDLVNRPPMMGPSQLRTQKASLLPGSMNYVDAVSPSMQFQPAIRVDPVAIQYEGAEIQEIQNRINQAFYVDIWLMIASAGGDRMTATEINARREEQMLQLGSVHGRIAKELLEPMIDKTFSVLVDRDLLPQPPPEAQNQELKIEFTSIMAQAQKLLGTVSMERFAGFAGNLSAARPDILDNLNVDEMVRIYGDQVGVPPDALNPRSTVQQIRQARARAEQAQQLRESGPDAVQAAKVLSETNVQGSNALDRMLRAYGAPS